MQRINERRMRMAERGNGEIWWGGYGNSGGRPNPFRYAISETDREEAEREEIDYQAAEEARRSRVLS